MATAWIRNRPELPGRESVREPWTPWFATIAETAEGRKPVVARCESEVALRTALDRRGIKAGGIRGPFDSEEQARSWCKRTA